MSEHVHGEKTFVARGLALTDLVPMNDLRRRYRAVRVDVEPALAEVLSSGIFLNGIFSTTFAQNFATSIGSVECILVANGTDALELALRSVLLARPSQAREVVSVANAGGYTTIACHQLGLTVVYADVDAATQLMSISSALASLTENTAAIVVTHLYGGVVDVLGLRDAVEAAGFGHVAIIEDCAQAHGATLGDVSVGSMGDVATFSFYPTKNLAAFGDAGALVSGEADIVAMARRLHQYGWSSKYNVDIPGGRNSRIDEMQAAILSRLLPKLPAWNAKRRHILDQYRSHASSALAFVEGGPGSVAHLAVALSENRASFRRFLSDRGIASDVHYPVLDCDQTGWQKRPMRVGPLGLAASRHAIPLIVTLPCFPEMTEKEVAQVCGALEDWS
jgi:aminotransferase EvaB